MRSFDEMESAMGCADASRCGREGNAQGAGEGKWGVEGSGGGGQDVGGGVKGRKRGSRGGLGVE